MLRILQTKTFIGIIAYIPLGEKFDQTRANSLPGNQHLNTLQFLNLNSFLGISILLPHNFALLMEGIVVQLDHRIRDYVVVMLVYLYSLVFRDGYGVDSVHF